MSGSQRTPAQRNAAQRHPAPGNPKKQKLWKRWWVWCCLLIGLVGVALNVPDRFETLKRWAGDGRAHLSAGLASLSSLLENRRGGGRERGGGTRAGHVESQREENLASVEPTLAEGWTTGDSQIDLYLRDEMRRWQEEFGFDDPVRFECIRCSMHAFRPFLLFRGGREAVGETCRDAHDDADRMRRRLSRSGSAFGRVGREEAVHRGTFLRDAIETAAAAWLEDKTIENVDPEVPPGGQPPLRAAARPLRAVRGNIFDSSGRLVWSGPPDLSATSNVRLAAAILEWIDDFQLSAEDVPTVARAILSRLLVLQPGPTGQPPTEPARSRACERGIAWLHDVKDDSRPLFRRTGWVNLPHLVRFSTESAERDVEAERESPIIQTGGVANSTGEGSAVSTVAWEKMGAQGIARESARPASLAAPFDAVTAKNAQTWWASGLKVPVAFTNSIGARLVLVPAGEFYMGSTALQFGQIRRFDPGLKKEWEREEQPQHLVRITRPIYFGVHEVTRGQFAQFLQSTGYQTESRRDGKGGSGFNVATGEFKQDQAFDWRNPGFAQSDNEPVVNVSWNDAAAFCEWLTRKEKITYRLPTEAEWEYACRAGSTSLFSSGDDPESLAAAANVADAVLRQKFPSWQAIAARDGYAFTAPVGSFRPNAFGLCDMHGNVWEWCHDWYARDYYAKSPDADPQGPARGTVRVFRGGSWYDTADMCRSAFRYWDVPSYRDYFLGFRVVAVPPGQ